MKRFLWCLYQPYKWLFYIPFLYLNTVVLGTIAVLLGIMKLERAADACGVLWARINTWTAPVFVKVRGKEFVEKGQAYVIVANHRSSFDILVVYAYLGVRFKWVMKKELRKVPGLGYGSKAVGHIFIDRSNTKKAIESIREAGNKIKNGVSVFFFPEGTRSKTGEMLPFKKGAFHLALDLGLPILPVSINGTDRILPSDTFDLFPGNAEIIFHPPVDTGKYDRNNIMELVREVREVIESGLKDHLRGDPSGTGRSHRPA